MVLDALFQIKNDIDPTFSFRRFVYFLSSVFHCIDLAVKVFAVPVL